MVEREANIIPESVVVNFWLGLKTQPLQWDDLSRFWPILRLRSLFEALGKGPIGRRPSKLPTVLIEEF
jgi:hypothetical protein